MAACYLKMGECRKSIEACNKVRIGTLFNYSVCPVRKNPSGNLTKKETILRRVTVLLCIVMIVMSFYYIIQVFV